MKNLIATTLACTLVAGCSNNGTQDTRYTGYAEGRYYDAESKKFNSKYFATDINNEKCIKKGDNFEISLRSLVFNQIFEGFLEDITSNKGNELGLFLTVRKTKNGDSAVVAKKNEEEKQQAATINNPVEKRLVYVSDSRLARVDINAANILLYSDKYDGENYSFEWEVIEFDSDSMKEYFDIAKDLASAAQESGISFNTPYSALLTKVGKTVFDKVSKDDVIMRYKYRAVACGSLEPNDDSVYLTKGDFAIVRVAQEESNIDWNRYTLNPSTKRLNHSSFLVYKISKVSNP